MKFFTMIALLLLIFATSGCALLGLEEDEDTTTIATAGSISDLQGTWMTSCEGERHLIQFSESSFIEESIYYEDSSCTVPTSSYSFSYTNLTVGNEWVYGYEFNGSIQSYTKTPKNNTYTSYYNNSSYCGFTDWQTDVPKEIIGTSCTNIERNTVITNWYKLEGNNLTLSTNSRTYTKQ